VRGNGMRWRRRGAAAAVLACLVLVASGCASSGAKRPAGGTAAAAGDTSLGLQTIPFYGAHQAGIITPAPDRLAFGAMNVVDGTSRADLRDLLQAWTTANWVLGAGLAHLVVISGPVPARLWWAWHRAQQLRAAGAGPGGAAE
jgi:hypothetical protein